MIGMEFVRGNQKGAILPVVLMIMLLLTMMGMAAITTTTTDLKISGNSRMQQNAFYGAEGGVNMYPPILTETLEARAVPRRFLQPLGPVIDSGNLRDELFGFPGSDGLLDEPEGSPDLKKSLNAVEVQVDVDRIQERLLSGAAAEFAGGYEGIGMSSAGGSVGIYYDINSIGQTGAIQGRVSEVYIYRVK